jgi:hypothetical protein
MVHSVPRETERFLVSYGGKNPFGLPKWRLIVASERMVKEAGVFRDWAPGLSIAERGGLNFSPNPNAPGCNFQPYSNKPLRVVTEVREVRRYPQAEGWILENWWPASRYGTQEDWYSYKAVDGITPMLGPYPECGDYEFIYALGSRLPTVATLESHISKYVSAQENKKGTPESRAQEYLQRYEENLELDEKKRKAEYEAQFRDHLSPLKSGSLAASRWRQYLAARTGNANEHIGIL